MAEPWISSKEQYGTVLLHSKNVREGRRVIEIQIPHFRNHLLIDYFSVLSSGFILVLAPSDLICLLFL